jgi:alanine racemase
MGEFQGRPVPLVARVSMDLTTFDVTDLPDIAVGSLITVLGGAGCTPDEAATRAGTIGYELLTGLGTRYHREYLRG